MSEAPDAARAGGAGVRKLVVVGAGTMGHGIAQVAGMAGAQVVLVDRSADLAEEGLRRIRQNLDTGVERGKVDAALRDRTVGRITGGADLEAGCADVDMVVEAVPERLALKREVLARAERASPAGALLASNTSSLSVSAMQKALAHPERMLGLHFFNPVHIMKLVEVVRGRETSDRALDVGVSFVRWIGKEPIIVRDSPGFASSRLGVALGLEAMRMLEEGVASAEDIDAAMTLGYRHPMGPLRLTDLVGLDVRLHVAEYLHEALAAERFRPPDILRRKVDAGELGQKSGRGFYDWSESAEDR